MRCELVTTSSGVVLRDVRTREIVFGPTYSYAKLSRFTVDNKVVITERKDESAPTSKGGGT